MHNNKCCLFHIYCSYKTCFGFILKGLLYLKGKFFVSVLLPPLSEPLVSGRDGADEPPTLIKEDLLSAAAVQRSPADTQVSTDTNTSQDCTKWDQDCLCQRQITEQTLKNQHRPLEHNENKHTFIHTSIFFTRSFLSLGSTGAYPSNLNKANNSSNYIKCFFFHYYHFDPQEVDDSGAPPLKKICTGENAVLR